MYILLILIATVTLGVGAERICLVMEIEKEKLFNSFVQMID